MATRSLEGSLNDAQEEEILRDVTRILHSDIKTAREVRAALEADAKTPRDKFFLEALRGRMEKR